MRLFCYSLAVLSLMSAWCCWTKPVVEIEVVEVEE